MNSPRKALLALLFLTSAAICSLHSENQWSQWRGPHRDGTVTGEPWPASLSENDLRVSWRVDLAEGYPGPIVHNDKVYTVETLDKEFEIARAFDRQNGRQLWETKWQGSMKVPFFAAKNGSWVRSTPATDGESVFIAGMRDVLVSLDAKTGEENWRLDFPKSFGTELPNFGFVCSPLLHEGFVYVQAGGGIAKIDKETGYLNWKVLDDGGGMNGSAFSSPIISSFDDRDQLIVQTRNDLTGLDPKQGTVLWKTPVKAYRGMNIITPTRYQDGFFTTTYGGRSQWLKVTGNADTFNVEQAWDNKLQGYMSTPVIVDGNAYLHLRNQRAASVNLASGEINWITTERFGKYWSMVAQGDRILALDEEGILLLIQANTEKLEIIARRKVSDQETWGHLAIAGNQLFVRELRGLIALEWSSQKELASR